MSALISRTPNPARAEGLEARILAFFKGYETLYRRALKNPEGLDAARLAKHFASDFVESSPGGAHGGKNGWMFRFMIGRGFAFYRKIGARDMTLDVVDTGIIDANHSMAKVAWEARCVREDGSEVTVSFEHIYFLRHAGRSFRIFAYIANDQRKLLEAHGLVPKKRK